MTRRTHSFLILCFATLFLFVLNSCSKKSSGSDSDTTSGSGQYIYVASGNTFAGTGITMSAAANTVAKYTIDGSFVEVIRDYSDADSYAGDTPVAILDYDDTSILVAVENATTVAYRRVERVAKDGSFISTYLMNAAAFNAANMVLKDLFFSGDGGLLVSKGIASANAVIEKFNSNKTRLTIGANAYVRAPAGSCATAQTQFSRITTGPSNIIIGAHAAATPNNKIILVSSNGYNTVADCLAAATGPDANHIPTSLLYHSGGKLLVGYGSSTGPVNDIYSYDVTSSAISNPIQAYNNSSVLQGISVISEGSDGSVYVGSSANTFNTIEKFTLDSTTGLLTRVGTTTLVGPSIYTRSISGILVP